MLVDLRDAILESDEINVHGCVHVASLSIGELRACDETIVLSIDARSQIQFNFQLSSVGS